MKKANAFHVGICARCAVDEVNEGNLNDAIKWLNNIIITADEICASTQDSDLVLLITSWMEHQIFDCGGPRYLFPTLEKTLDRLWYDWMATSNRVLWVPRHKCRRDELMADFASAVAELSPEQQQEMWAAICSGYFDMPKYTRIEVSNG